MNMHPEIYFCFCVLSINKMHILVFKFWFCFLWISIINAPTHSDSRNMHQHIHKYTDLEWIGWIQSLSVGFTPKEQARPKIGMRNVPHLDLCGENPSHLLLGRFHDNAWVQLFQGLSLGTPNHWKSGHLPKGLCSELCVIFLLQNYFILIYTHIHPHLDKLLFSLKQCLVLVTTTLKWNLWRYCLIKNVTEHQVSLLLWIQRPLPPHPNIQKESAVPTF